MRYVVVFIVSFVILGIYFKRRSDKRQSEIDEMLRKHMEDNPTTESESEYFNECGTHLYLGSFPLGSLMGNYLGQTMIPSDQDKMRKIMQNQFRDYYAGAAHTPSESSQCKYEKVINPTIEITESKDKEAE